MRLSLLCLIGLLIAIQVSTQAQPISKAPPLANVSQQPKSASP
ncbi:hypothetical protein [Spirosoma foliorum]|nr:hypothetical protein [Spirosoma foliorum]